MQNSSFLGHLVYRKLIYDRNRRLLVTPTLFVRADCLLNIQDFPPQIGAGINITGYFFIAVADS